MAAPTVGVWLTPPNKRARGMRTALARPANDHLAPVVMGDSLAKCDSGGPGSLWATTNSSTGVSDGGASLATSQSPPSLWDDEVVVVSPPASKTSGCEAEPDDDCVVVPKDRISPSKLKKLREESREWEEGLRMRRAHVESVAWHQYERDAARTERRFARQRLSQAFLP